MNTMRILFIGKQDDPYSQRAADFVMDYFENPMIIFSKREIPFPEQLLSWDGDLLISYLSQWIIPDRLLKNAGFAAINFHPGPPEYPGIGCTNFAIYNGEKEYGVTCHHMFPKVDSGPIIAVTRFPLLESDTVYSLTQRCYMAILDLFTDLMKGILKGNTLPVSSEGWKRKPFKRKDLDLLCELTPEMTGEEIKRRLKATTYGEKVWAYTKVNGERLEYGKAQNKPGQSH